MRLSWPPLSCARTSSALSLLTCAALLLASPALGCTVFELSEKGFAQNAFSLLHAVTIHDGINGTLYMDNAKFNYKCTEGGGWHDFFAYDDHLVPWTAEKERAAGEACSRKGAPEVEEAVQKIAYNGGNEALDLIAVQRAWKYLPWVQELLDKRLAKLADREGPTIGFHIRGGDMLHTNQFLNRPTTTPRDYIQTFASTYPKVKGGTCIILGDEHAKVTEAAKLAEQVLKCKVMRGPAMQGSEKKEGHNEERFNQEDLKAKCAATAQILVDLELLAHTDYFVATDHSRWAHIVGYLRYALYGKEKSTYVDASAIHADLYSLLRRYVASETSKLQYFQKLSQGGEKITGGEKDAKQRAAALEGDVEVI